MKKYEKNLKEYDDGTRENMKEKKYAENKKEYPLQCRLWDLEKIDFYPSS